MNHRRAKAAKQRWLEEKRRSPTSRATLLARADYRRARRLSQDDERGHDRGHEHGQTEDE